MPIKWYHCTCFVISTSRNVLGKSIYVYRPQKKTKSHHFSLYRLSRWQKLLANVAEITSFHVGQVGNLAGHPLDMLTAPSSCPASSHRRQPRQMSRISKFPTDRGGANELQSICTYETLEKMTCTGKSDRWRCSSGRFSARFKDPWDTKKSLL